jgi:hypothetical protein
MYALILSATPIISFFPGQNMFQAISSLPTLKSLPEYTRGRQFFCGEDEENRRKLPHIDKILTGFPGRLLLSMLCQIFPGHIHLVNGFCYAKPLSMHAKKHRTLFVDRIDKQRTMLFAKSD